ncbi:DinB family protein [Sphingosinicella rhizophila]|uniref:DinB family protein n=1 Tax=Sphingosinicella rhizophila TaxID=3050082 RepID=A0ABU3Q9J6_9SPHN|nr:DinB family protein [Sphingosinicella sp. GR2756]MDT9600081.1 DinB family protein [Sphingosinicella sp. GR2756]
MIESRTRLLLVEQFDVAWSLACYHLEGVTDGECLWEPASPCLHVRRQDDGAWRPDWPETEGYDIGPPSIAWTTWHICFWWTNAFRGQQGETPLAPQAVTWPRDADLIRSSVRSLHERWRALLERCDEAGLQESRAESWTIPNASLERIAAWLNVELMKNAAEIGVMRFLHATHRSPRPS